jgi:hypothetical protein
MTKRLLALSLGAAGLLASQAASAQEFLRDRRYQEGIGVQVGDLELHPGIAGEVGYDSNWLLRSDREGPNIVNGPPRLGTGVLRITPSLTLSTLRGQRREGTDQGDPPVVAFRAGLSATYREFLAPELRNQRNLSAQADGRLDILPARPWGGGLYVNYARVVNPSTLNNPDLTFTRDVVGGGGELIFTPNNGTLNWRLGYRAGFTFFEDQIGRSFNNVVHDVYTRGQWAFRPRTALIYDATLGFFNYTNRQSTLVLQDSTPVRARLGLNGLVTSRLSVLVLGGWGASFFDTSVGPQVEQYDSVIGQAEVRWFPTAQPGLSSETGEVSLTLSSVSLGYSRDFVNSYVGRFYGQDRGYLRAVWFFAGRALVSLQGGVSAIQYPNFYFANGALRHPSDTDLRYDATLFTEYRFSNTFAINATGRYTQNVSDIQLPEEAAPAAGAPLRVFDFNWQRFEAYIGARWFM